MCTGKWLICINMQRYQWYHNDIDTLPRIWCLYCIATNRLMACNSTAFPGFRFSILKQWLLLAVWVSMILSMRLEHSPIKLEMIQHGKDIFGYIWHIKFICPPYFLLHDLAPCGNPPVTWRPLGSQGVTRNSGSNWASSCDSLPLSSQVFMGLWMCSKHKLSIIQWP